MTAALALPPTIESRLQQMFNRDAAAPALCGPSTQSYACLGARVGALVAQLRELELAPGSRVGLYLPRSADLLAAMLACLHEGLCFVALEPEFPLQRLQMIAEDAQLALVLCATAADAGLFRAGRALVAGAAAVADWPARDPGLPAYMMFTSGSTGRPKGVVISRRALATFLAAACRRLALDAQVRWLFITTPAFDISLLELLGPLWCGGALQLVEAPANRDPDALRALLDGDPAISHLQATPAFWRMLLGSGWQGSPKLVALCGGEALDASLAQALVPRVARLWNCYGPTEATVWSLMTPVRLPLEPHGVLLGQSLDGYRHWVLDEQGAALGIGGEGELCIEGAALAEGYWQRPDLSAAAFIERDGRRLYRTGDRVQRVAEDAYRYLGRLDDQVKLRGFRIELGEIEAHLRALEGVQDAAVRLLGEGEQAALVAWVQTRREAAPTRLAIRRALQRSLPHYMVPARIQLLDALPKTASGKIDRKQLRLE